MQRLLINRVSLSFKHDAPIFLVVRVVADPVLCKNKARWVRDNLSDADRSEFFKWMNRHNVDDGDFLITEFKGQLLPEEAAQDAFIAELADGNHKPFEKEIFKQELGSHLQSKGMLIEPFKLPLSFAAYQRTNSFDEEYDQYRRIDLRWNPKREELSFNIGSERTLVAKSSDAIEGGALVFDAGKSLVYRAQENVRGKSTCPRDISIQRTGAPKRFSYRERYEQLKVIASDYLYDFNSPYFFVDKTGLINVGPEEFHSVFTQQNQMIFGNDKTAINAVTGMREYGPFRKAAEPEKKRLLFIYQNKNDANTLYRYLKNGIKHFPGLLSYVGIPVALAEPDKGLPYKDAVTLVGVLSELLETHYSDRPLYPDVLAVVIGPFKRYESDEEESESYYKIKKLLLDKGIASQFVSADTLNSSGVHYSLPNIAIAILAKLGGIPWKLANKKTSELIVGFNTKRAKGDRRNYLGSAVFFDNEGRLGGVKGLPSGDEAAIIEHLRVAITDYVRQVGEPDRLVIHYYKPHRKDEIQNIEKLLEEMALAIPIAVVEVNDSKSKLDICFDADFKMGMPESGIFVKIGFNEYLLFNNNRYIKNPPRKIDDELPIKLKLGYVNTGGFSTHELIAQVYEFSRLNWKGLRQRSVPVTTTYSKAIADFALHLDGQIPQNDVATKTPWFI